jgi:ketosteroid isomerase-like protein
MKETETKPDTAIDKQSAKSFIDSINAKFSEEIKRGDSVALAAHYSADAELLFANSEPIKGKDILSAWAGLINMGVKEMNFTTTDITVNADLLAETGKYEILGDKNALIDRGKYLVVWKKENGEWKLFRDMGNTSLPAKN